MLLDSIGLVARFRPDGNGTEGSRVYGPCPASLAGSGYAGMRKRFKARWTTGNRRTRADALAASPFPPSSGSLRIPLFVDGLQRILDQLLIEEQSRGT